VNVGSLGDPGTYGGMRPRLMRNHAAAILEGWPNEAAVVCLRRERNVAPDPRRSKSAGTIDDDVFRGAS
jgi:hypothetical protein